MTSSGRRATWLAMGLVSLVAGGIALADGDGPSYSTARDCVEHQGYVQGDEAAVAARLPRRYTPVRDTSSGAPIVFARALRCAALTIDGRARPAVLASYGIVVESPDGRGCASASPAGSAKGDVPPMCNWYTLSLLTDDRRVADWLREGTGFPARHATDLVFDVRERERVGGTPFHFEAPGRFALDDVFRERPGELSVRVGYWADTPRGTVKLAGAAEDLTAGEAEGTVRAPAGSELAALMGAVERPYLSGHTQLAAVHIPFGSYRKQLIGPPGPGETLDSFSGSCAIPGTAGFTPPASNQQQSLAVTFEGDGTCSGMLNGRKLTDAPVTMRHSVRADGSCVQARTSQPGSGTLTFADGTRVAYTFDFAFTGTDGDFEFYGTRSGFAAGHGTFANDRAPDDALLQCAAGTADDLPLDVELTTKTPLVSRRTAGVSGRRPATGPGTPAGAQALRLAVRPRSARAGRRTRFAFRVTTGEGRAVAGALVRFAGRHVRTGSRGRARMTVTLRRPARRTARATRRGFRPVTARVRVRPRR